MQMIARGFLVWELTESAALVGVVSAASGVPLLGLSLFSGVIVDRMERKRLIQASQLASASIALAIGLSIAAGTVTWLHLLAAAMVQGAMWSVLEPARLALIPQLVGREKLNNAIALNGAGMSLTILIMPAIGGLLYALIEPQGAYYVIAAFSLIAVALTTLIATPAQEPRNARSSMLVEIKEGLLYIRRNSLLIVLLAVALSTVLFSMPFKFLLPVFVGDIYHRESEAFGLLVSMMGLGTLIGSLFIASLGKWKRGLLLIAATLASGVALLLVALVPFYLAALGIMVILGLGDAGRRVLNLGLIIEHAEDQFRGRVMSVHTMNFGLMPIGVLPAGLAIELLGGRVTVAILGVAMIVVATLLLATQKRLRDLQ